MRKTEFNNFELLLMTAAEATANDFADEFMAIDTTGIEMSPKSDIKIRRYIRRNRKHMGFWKPARVLLAACLIAMSVAFTACMTIPQIREAIKCVVVQWYDDYFAINFSDAPDAAATQPAPEETIPDTPPTAIEKKAYATYLPDDYVGKVTTDTSMYYQINYFDDNENLVIILRQKIIDSEMTWSDDAGAVPREITINGHKAYLLTYQDEPNVYMLIWQDYYYQYSVYGMFENEADVIKFAENVKVW